MGFPPTYDININDKDLVESSLSYDQEEEYVAYWIPLIFYSIHPEKEESLEEINLLDSIVFFMKVLHIVCLMKALTMKSFILVLKKLTVLISLG